MSADLYPGRLYWDGSRGCAKWDGDGIELAAMPTIPGLPPCTTEVDYAPGVVYMLRESRDARRDMQAGEIRAVRMWLEARSWKEEAPC